MKKLMLSMVALLMAMSVNAQKYLNSDDTPFSEGKFYVGASFSGLEAKYSKASDFNIGIQAKAGYLFLDNWMVVGQLGYDSRSNGDLVELELGAGARYYFDKIGLYAGATAKYAHAKVSGGDSYNDFVPEIYCGYCFFLSRKLTIEPEVYYAHSFKDSDNSTFGLRLGFGLFF